MENGPTLFLIDTNEIDNYIHQKILKSFFSNIKILTFSNSTDALEYLEKILLMPEYIFLGLDFSESNVFEFFERYEKLNLDKKDTLVYVLSTLLLPKHREKLKNEYNYICCIEKPLSVEKLMEVIDLNHSEPKLKTRI